MFVCKCMCGSCLNYIATLLDKSLEFTVIQGSDFALHLSKISDHISSTCGLKIVFVM